MNCHLIRGHVLGLVLYQNTKTSTTFIEALHLLHCKHHLQKHHQQKIQVSLVIVYIFLIENNNSSLV